MLFATQTTMTVPSLMGSIMCIGVATANRILLVTFANDERIDGKDSIAAALSAGYTRIRPVVMTAAAIIIGMAPMALGLGEGGEQNAPLGRAVIGGLLFATVLSHSDKSRNICSIYAGFAALPNRPRLKLTVAQTVSNASVDSSCGTRPISERASR